MRIVNVLQILNGIPNMIESFPIWEEQLSGEVIEQAEKFFLEICSKPDKEFTEEEKEYLLDEGSYDDQNGHEVYIIWSN